MPRWRRNSEFGPGPRVPLCREQRARFLFLVRMHRSPGRLSAAALQVATALVRLLGSDGRLDPAHDTLARLASVHPATVRRALDRMRDLGLLHWTRRLVRCGWRTEQASNAYVLTPRNTAAFAPARCAAQIARPAKPKTSLNPSTASWRRFPAPQPPRLTVAEQIAFCLTGQVPA
jgi:hypothetical protein